MNGTLRSRCVSSGAHAFYALLVPLVSMTVVSLAAVPASAADGHGIPMPKAQAFDGDKPLPSVKEVTNLCSQGKGCRFIVDGVQEYRGGFVSVGDSYLNCTDHDISVSRTITYQPTITDNIGGNIAGRASRTGSVEGSSEISLAGTAEGTETITKTNETYTPNFNDATSSDRDQSATAVRLSGKISGNSSGSQTSEQAFEDSASRTYSRTWDDSVESSTTIDANAPAGDVLTLGYVGMGHRVKGTLKAVGTSKYVKNVVVDEPSFTEASAFVAQTYTAPKGSCVDNRPTGRAAQLFKLLKGMQQKPQDAVPAKRD